MKILIFHYNIPRKLNIVPPQVLQIESFAKCLRKKGATVAIIARRSYENSNHKARSRKCFNILLFLQGTGIKTILNNFQDFINEFRLIKKNKPDVVIVWFQNLSFSVLVASKILKRPCLIFLDGPISYINRFYLNSHNLPIIPEIIESISCKLANSVITQSEFSKEVLIKNGIKAKKYYVCPNGVDLEMFKPSGEASLIRTSLNWNDNFVFGFQGAFQIWHNPPEMIWFIKKMAKLRPQTRFLLVGDGPFREMIEKEIKEFIREKIVFMTGNVPWNEVVAYLRAMDALFAPYVRHDIFFLSPMKVLESMATGVPVLTTGQGELNGLVSDGVDGFLYECGNQNMLIRKAIMMVDNKHLCHEMGKKARVKIESERSWDQVILPLWDAVNAIV